MAGCDGWRDLTAVALHRFAGHQVVIMLDADAGGNLNVYEAGELLATELESEGAVPGCHPRSCCVPSTRIMTIRSRQKRLPLRRSRCLLSIGTATAR